MRILAGDIGGTHVRLAVFESTGAKLSKVAEHTAASREYGSLAGPVAEFLDGLGTACDRAVFGIAGPVRCGQVRTTNLPWVVDGGFLAGRFGFDDVVLLNDLEATAWGLDDLGPEDVRVLHGGAADAIGNRAVVAAGTGLGVAGLHFDGERHHPFATEGGHAGFAPSSDEELALLRHLQARYGRVSWERVVSGPGLVAIYEVLSGGSPSPVAVRSDGRDAAAEIAAAAEADADGAAARSLRLFAGLYGALAGDVALVLMATGGVWVAGGIAPKLLSVLEAGEFVARFSAKGRMTPLVEAIPVRVVLADDVALWGAARRAQRLDTGSV